MTKLHLVSTILSMTLALTAPGCDHEFTPPHAGRVRNQCSTDEAVDASLSPECAACICEHGKEEATACSSDPQNACWLLIACVNNECAGAEGADRTACAVEACSAYFGGAATAQPVGDVVDASCSVECAPPQ